MDSPDVWSGLDDAGPVGYGDIPFALEGVEVPVELVRGAVTAHRPERLEDVELGEDEVHDLRGADFESPFLEEERERVGRAIAGDLQNALVDGHDRDLSRFRARVLDGEIGTGLCFGRNVEHDAVRPFFPADGERNARVAERAHENFLRGNGAREHDRHVAVAFEVGGNGNALHARGPARLEPCARVYLVPFDRDESRAGIGRLDEEFDGIPIFVVLPVELDFELRRAREAPLDVLIADDGPCDLVVLKAVLAGQRELVVSFGRRRDRIAEALLRDREGLGLDGVALADGLVFVLTVRLLDEHRHILDFGKRRGEIGYRAPLERGIDGDE